MARRSRARAIVFQALFRSDFDADVEVAMDDEFIHRRLLGNAELVQFATDLLAGVRAHRDALDCVLTEKAANWSLHRMAATDRNVLRMGAYELLHTDTPRSVVIDEAVELARRFGSAQSARFVNGILDQIHPAGCAE